jgi:hypothetical protein
MLVLMILEAIGVVLRVQELLLNCVTTKAVTPVQSFMMRPSASVL